MSEGPEHGADLRLLIDAIGDHAIYMLDPQGRITSWNSGARHLHGYRFEEVRGETFARFFTPEDRRTGVPEKMLDEARRTGRVETEGWRLRRNGSRFWTIGAMHAVRG